MKTLSCKTGDATFTVIIDEGQNAVIETAPALISTDTEAEAGSLEFNAAVHTLEALVLAQAAAGIDISTPEYASAIQTVLDKISNENGD